MYTLEKMGQHMHRVSRHTYLDYIYIEIHIIHLHVLIETSKQTNNNQTNKETIFTLQGEMNEMKYETLGT